VVGAVVSLSPLTISLAQGITTASYSIGEALAHYCRYVCLDIDHCKFKDSAWISGTNRGQDRYWRWWRIDLWRFVSGLCLGHRIWTQLYLRTFRGRNPSSATFRSSRNSRHGQQWEEEFE
jgi:hypothetical protein